MGLQIIEVANVCQTKLVTCLASHLKIKKYIFAALCFGGES